MTKSIVSFSCVLLRFISRFVKIIYFKEKGGRPPVVNFVHYNLHLISMANESEENLAVIYLALT